MLILEFHHLVRRDANTVALHHQIRSHQAYLTDLGGTLLIDATLLHTIDADDIPADLTYTITYANTGAMAASGVVISDTIPTNTTFKSASDGGTTPLSRSDRSYSSSANPALYPSAER